MGSRSTGNSGCYGSNQRSSDGNRTNGDLHQHAYRYANSTDGDADEHAGSTDGDIRTHRHAGSADARAELKKPHQVNRVSPTESLPPMPPTGR